MEMLMCSTTANEMSEKYLMTDVRAWDNLLVMSIIKWLFGKYDKLKNMLEEQIKSVDSGIINRLEMSDKTGML